MEKSASSVFMESLHYSLLTFSQLKLYINVSGSLVTIAWCTFRLYMVIACRYEGLLKYTEYAGQTSLESWLWG
jgi:hypothetical protein